MAKPIEELIAMTQDEHAAAPRLGVYPEFVVQWRPRKHWQTGRIEPGWEPSAGFIAVALAILRSSPVEKKELIVLRFSTTRRSPP